MINLKRSVNKGGSSYIEKFPERKLHPLEALAIFAEVDLYYNYEIKIKEIEGMLGIEVQTRVLLDKETAFYIGKKEEMLPLCLVLYYLEEDLQLTHFLPKLDLLENRKLVSSIPTTMKIDRLRTAVLLSCGLTDKDIETGRRSNVDIVDMVAAFRLFQEGTCKTFQEALELAA